MRVQVTAPYVTLKVADRDGMNVLIGYQSGTIVDNVEQASLQHHLDRGLVVEYVEAEPEPEPGEPSAPAKSAAKPEWVAYAVSQGATPEDAEGATKDELIELYGS